MRNAKRIAALALAMVVALTSLFATVSFAASFSVTILGMFICSTPCFLLLDSFQSCNDSL